ncbi:MAG TPA: MBL fold metallo-hydrolase [Ktedonobacteraceae bacterium]|nr:MBL fold metallo-hydrolase [Ktedonobacteraceae bacterium]
MKTILVETLREWLEEGLPVTLLDVRPASERAEWSIPGSLHVDAYDALKAHDPHALISFELPNSNPVVTICAAGKTSQIAVEQLAARGILAYSLEGGMKAWSLAWNTAELTVPESTVRIVQLRRTGKGCLSYLIGAGNEAFVIDASLNPQVYLALAQAHGWQISSVFDTHIHADHLSRSRQLAQMSGAMLFLPAQERVSFPFTAIRDGNTLATGTMQLTALRTPGHTGESTCYLLNNRVLFTGDTLFLTSVGRPDLEANERETQARATALYSSLHKLLALTLDTLVLPGHTSQPVPFDGVPIVSPLAQIDEQVSVLHVPHSTFVANILARIPPTPPNYDRIVRLNEQGIFPEDDVTNFEAGANRCAIA